MQAVVTILDDAAYRRIEAMWRVLELKCGLKGIKTTPYPHFSWQLAEAYDIKKIEGAIGRLSARAQPMVVQTSGLGVFTGAEPVIYVMIVKDIKLFHFHNLLYRRLKSLAQDYNEFYTPDAWIPHITLAHSDVSREGLSCAVKEFANLPLNWEIRIDNLALVGQVDDEVGQLIRRFDFVNTG